MSTRAVYTFTKTSNKPEVHIYIHCDGYPDGAKQYLHKMAHEGIGPESLLRMVKKSEITTHWKDHGDLEYRYEIKGRSWKCDVLAYQVKPSGDYTCFGCWTLLDFVNDIKNPWDGEMPHQFQMIDLGYTSVAHNITTARRYLEEGHSPLAHLRIWRGRHEGTANWRSCVKDLQRLVDAFPELRDGEIDELLKPRPLAQLANKE